MIDPELEAVLDFMPVIDLDDPVKARREFEKLLVTMRTPLPEAELLDIEDRLIPGWEGDPEVPVRVYRPKAVAANPGTTVPGVLQIHGGGFIVGSVEAEHAGAVLTAVDLGAVLVSVDYRLAPEHPFPAALDDARAAVDALVAAGVAPGGLGIAGDSAGGGLAVATAMAQRDAGRPGPAALVCSSPWVDLALTGASIDGRAGEDPILSRGWLAAMAGRYLGDADPRDPAASPLYGDLRGLPPLLVLVGTAEVLHDDAVRLFERAAAADVETELEAYPGCIHLWMQLAPGAPEAQEAATRVGRFLRHRLTAGR